MSPMRKTVNIEQAMALTGLSRSALYYRMAHGLITFTVTQCSRRIDRESLPQRRAVHDAPEADPEAYFLGE